MIVSVNPTPDISEFRRLMARTDLFLNEDAAKRPKYYASRGGNPLEDDVKAALDECAKGTPFENTIEKVSGQKFPDIVAANYFGIEVKSTKDDHWTSTGSSILETTRVNGVERIYMTFGKLGGNPILFKSKPYEECLYGIAVTHMPRYLIDMRLNKGETIFDKIDITYDELRNLENPIAPVSKYYRSQLKPGESLWWAGDSVDESVSATIRLWKNVPTEEKRRFTAYACANYPEIFSGDYDRYSLWLTSQGVVDPHIRDQFSAGGQEEMTMPDGSKVKFPGVFRRVKNNMDYFVYYVAQKEPLLVKTVPLQKVELNRRLLAWAKEVSKATTMKESLTMDALSMLFWGTDASDAIKGLETRTGESWVACASCNKVYRQRRIRQQDGQKCREDDECPYCGSKNGSSMEWEYQNRR